jgi:hypothetical protein
VQFCSHNVILSVPDESFDKTFHVSVAIDGITADRKPVTILHSDRAHNRYGSLINLLAQMKHSSSVTHFLHGKFISSKPTTV